MRGLFASLRWSLPLLVVAGVTVWLLRERAPADDEALLATYSLSLRAAAKEPEGEPSRPAPPSAGEIRLRPGGKLELHLRSEGSASETPRLSVFLVAEGGGESELSVESHRADSGALLGVAGLPEALPPRGELAIVLRAPSPLPLPDPSNVDPDAAERRWSVPFARLD